MQKILVIAKAKTINTEKVVKNIGLKLQNILEIEPKIVNTEKIVKNISQTPANTRKYYDVVKGILKVLAIILQKTRKEQTLIRALAQTPDYINLSQKNTIRFLPTSCQMLVRNC